MWNAKPVPIRFFSSRESNDTYEGLHATSAMTSPYSDLHVYQNTRTREAETPDYINMKALNNDGTVTPISVLVRPPSDNVQYEIVDKTNSGTDKAPVERVEYEIMSWRCDLNNGTWK